MPHTPDPTRHTHTRVKAPVPEQVDVAIIGAGLGGLMAGLSLARQGQKVVVLDSHYVAGGCCTMFGRGRADARFYFDVGLHYIGTCQPGGRIHSLLADVGITDIEYRPLDPDGFDTLIFPDFQFRIPADRGLFRDRLVAMFPEEKKGIDRYIRLLVEVEHMAAVTEARKGGLAMAWQALVHGRLAAQYQNQTIGAFLDTCTRNMALRAVLLGQNGDYGLPPSKASAMIHAGLTNHYFGGAYYPVGGGQVIADRLSEEIEAHGGQVLLRRPVDRILVEGGRAVGVRVAAMRQDPQEIRAKAVISNADLIGTLTRLLPADALPAEWAARVPRFEMASAIFLTTLGLKRTPALDRFGATNYWIFDRVDMEDLYRNMGAGEAPRCAYLTSGSAKDPETPHHAPEGAMSVEAMTVLPGDPRWWGVSPDDIQSGRYRDNPTYKARKLATEEAMIDAVERLFPGSRDAILFRESASPVTHTRYTHASMGSGYGLAATPEQFLKGRPGYRGPIPGLYLAGANTRAGHGVLGALSSGANAARRVRGDLGR